MSEISTQSPTSSSMNLIMSFGIIIPLLFDPISLICVFILFSNIKYYLNVSVLNRMGTWNSLRDTMKHRNSSFQSEKNKKDVFESLFRINPFSSHTIFTKPSCFSITIFTNLVRSASRPEFLFTNYTIFEKIVMFIWFWCFWRYHSSSSIRLLALSHFRKPVVSFLCSTQELYNLHLFSFLWGHLYNFLFLPKFADLWEQCLETVRNGQLFFILCVKFIYWNI